LEQPIACHNLTLNQFNPLRWSDSRWYFGRLSLLTLGAILQCRKIQRCHCTPIPGWRDQLKSVNLTDLSYALKVVITAGLFRAEQWNNGGV
jgi:hypothetical protein